METIPVYGALRTYVNETLEGGGALKGKNCNISKIEKDGDTNTVTFSWTLDNGTVKTGTMLVKDGASIQSIAIDADNHIIATLTDGTKVDGGEMPATEVDISKETGNVLEKKDDGLFVPKGAVEISKKDGNIIKAETDGLYAKADEINIDPDATNILENRVDGLYVPDDYVKKEDGKSLVADEDIEQITTNKTAIEVLNGDAETAGSVDKKLADAIATLNKLEKKILDHIPTVEEAKDNVLYMVESETAGTYNQYMLIDGTIANLGSTEVDLDGYAKTEDVVLLQQQIVDQGKVMTIGEDGKVAPVKLKVEDLEDAEDYAKVEALDDYLLIEQGAEFAGKALVVGDDGNVEPSDIEIESPSWTGTTDEFKVLDKSTLKNGQQINFIDDTEASIIVSFSTIAEFKEFLQTHRSSGVFLYKSPVGAGAFTEFITKGKTVASASGVMCIKNNGTDGLFVDFQIYDGYLNAYVSRYSENYDEVTKCYKLQNGKYSTDEQVVGEWIDGKPIYRRVFNISTSIVIASSSWTSAHTADWVSTIEAIIGVGAQLTNYQGASYCHSFFAQKSGSTISLRSAMDTRANTVILEYTKTTD